MTTATAQDPATETTGLTRLRTLARELDNLRQALSLLSWDEQTKMPSPGAGDRAAAKSLLSGIVHDRATSDELRAAIESVEDADPNNVEAARMRRHYEQATCIPNEFVREQSEVVSAANQAWQQARSEDRFELFADHLDRVFELARREAELRGYETEPYDALLDQYEEGMTADVLAGLFSDLRAPSRELLDSLDAPDWSLLQQHYDVDVQRALAPSFAESVGFDLSRGRIDDTTHPFCSGIGIGDTRLTARYIEDWLPGGIFAVIHEAGHGVYGQGVENAALPATINGAAGMGTHESQSRFFENIVGRSLPYWEHHYPRLQAAFPEQLGSVDVTAFHQAINQSGPSLIRVEADELTYNLHVGLRFELERALLAGELAAHDLPEAWNSKMREWVGIEPGSDREGCLQDVHWSFGLIGYFPTYTLGNVYAAQYLQAVRADIPDLDDQLRAGTIEPLRSWFQERIYDHGEVYTGRELLTRATGQDVDATPLVEYLRGRFG